MPASKGSVPASKGPKQEDQAGFGAGTRALEAGMGVTIALGDDSLIGDDALIGAGLGKDPLLGEDALADAATSASVGLPVDTIETGACVGCTSAPVVVWWIAPSLRADSPVCVVGGITTLPGTVGFGDAAISASVGLPVDTMDTGACVGCTSV